MANLASAWKPGDPQPFSPGLPTSLYVQDQCLYHYDVVRTADHFLDGTKQRVRASVKVVIAPRVTSAGATNVVVDLSRAPPPMPPPRPRVGLRPKSFFDDRSDPDWCRDYVCFVELGGASGHPDFLRRLRGKGDNPSVQESGTETEVYGSPPRRARGDFLRDPTTAKPCRGADARSRRPPVSARRRLWTRRGRAHPRGRRVRGDQEERDQRRDGPRQPSRRGIPRGARRFAPG